MVINQIHHDNDLGIKEYSGLEILVCSVEIVNKEIEKRKMNFKQNKIKELYDKDIKRIINIFTKSKEFSNKNGL